MAGVAFAAIRSAGSHAHGAERGSVVVWLEHAIATSRRSCRGPGLRTWGSPRRESASVLRRVAGRGSMSSAMQAYEKFSPLHRRVVRVDTGDEHTLSRRMGFNGVRIGCLPFRAGAPAQGTFRMTSPGPVLPMISATLVRVVACISGAMPPALNTAKLVSCLDGCHGRHGGGASISGCRVLPKKFFRCGRLAAKNLRQANVALLNRHS